jgi:hypothetical protein
MKSKPGPKPRDRVHSIPLVIPTPTPRECQWPIGTPRVAGFRFCGRPDTVPGRPYCAEHYAMAYQVRRP